jgi:hypothetical protein
MGSSGAGRFVFQQVEGEARMGAQAFDERLA